MTALNLAKPEDFDRLVPLVQAFQSEAGIENSAENLREALHPLLEGSPYGAAYLLGPARAPIGYIVIVFTWSLEFAGLEGYVDEFYIRPNVRGRGIGAEVLRTLPKALAGAGLNALSLEVQRDNERAIRLYSRARFISRDDYVMMTRKL